MKKIILMVIAALALPVIAHCADVNIAPKCRIQASDIANPAWDPRNVADNDIGPTRGWLGTFDLQKPPWVRFVFPYPSTVTKIKLLPASYTEIEWKRYSRPKKITVLVKGDKTEAKQVDLADKEDVFAEIPVDMVNVYEISIVIDEIYQGKKYPEQTGFQEVQILVPDSAEALVSGEAQGGYETLPDPVTETKEALKKAAEAVTDDSAEKKSDIKKPQGTISPDEKEILDLMRKLLDKLEQKFLED